MLKKQKQKQISDTLQTSKAIPVPQSVQEVFAFDTPIYHNMKPSGNHVKPQREFKSPTYTFIQIKTDYLTYYLETFVFYFNIIFRITGDMESLNY